MSSVLILARDFIERMSNPVFGLSVNEEYALEFGQLLQSKEFAEQLRRDIQSLQHPTDMTSHVWMWLLGWARSHGVALQDQLLLELFDQWSSVFVKADIVDLIVTASPESPRRLERGDQEEALNPIIAEIIERSTDFERNERDAGSVVPSLGRAEATLVALLQVGRPATLQGARVLLGRQWPGRERLLAFFWSLVDSLEEETRAAWIDEVKPPPRESSAR